MKHKDREFIKEMLKDERVPPFDPKEAFAKFEKQFPLNDSTEEVIEEYPFRKKDKNKFKWKYWVPAVAASVVVFSITCGVSVYLTKEKYDEQRSSEAEYFFRQTYKNVLLTNIILLENSTMPFSVEVYFCSTENKENYFAAYAEVFGLDYFSLEINSEKIELNKTAKYYTKKLDGTKSFEYKLSFNSGEYETFTFKTEFYQEYING